MTADDALSSPHARALIAAIDAGHSYGSFFCPACLRADATSLPGKGWLCRCGHVFRHALSESDLIGLLADLLEDAGDRRASGLRAAAARGPGLIDVSGEYARRGLLRRAWRWADRRRLGLDEYAVHDSRFAAFLALAEAQSDA